MSGGGIGGFLAELRPATRARVGCGRWWGRAVVGGLRAEPEVIARGLFPLQESSAVLLPASPRELPLNSEAKGLAGVFFLLLPRQQTGPLLL